MAEDNSFPIHLLRPLSPNRQGQSRKSENEVEQISILSNYHNRESKRVRANEEGSSSDEARTHTHRQGEGTPTHGSPSFDERRKTRTTSFPVKGESGQNVGLHAHEHDDNAFLYMNHEARNKFSIPTRLEQFKDGYVRLRKQHGSRLHQSYRQNSHVYPRR